MYELGVKPSAIRNLFEYGKQRKAIIGEENVFDFSLGNPNVPAPKIVNDTLIKLINEQSPTVLHGYTSAVGDNNVRLAIASYLNIKQNTYSQYENGVRQIPYDLLIKLALYYDTSIDYILELTNVSTPYPRK